MGGNIESLESGETDEGAGFLEFVEKGTKDIFIHIGINPSHSKLVNEKVIQVPISKKLRVKNSISSNPQDRKLLFQCQVFESSDVIEGMVEVVSRLTSGTRTFRNVSVNLIGQVENYEDNIVQYFIKKTIVLDYNITMNKDFKKNYKFIFKGLTLPCESYHGGKVKIRYSIRFQMDDTTTKFKEIWIVHHVPKPRRPIVETGHICMIGHENKFRIEVKFNKQWVDLNQSNNNGTIDGRITFVSVVKPLNFGYISVVRREKFVSSSMDSEIFRVILFDLQNSSENDIMNFVRKNQSIPFRLQLTGKPEISHKLIPTINSAVRRNICIKYFVKAVFQDTENRKFFKFYELFLFRNGPKIQNQAPISYVQNHNQSSYENVGSLGNNQRMQAQFPALNIVLDIPEGTHFEDEEDDIPQINYENPNPSDSVHPTYFI